MKKQYMALIKVLKIKLKRAKEKLEDIRTIVDEKAASNSQKQEFVKLSSQVDLLEDIIDLAEGMIESEKNSGQSE